MEHGGERPAAAGNLGVGSPNSRNVAFIRWRTDYRALGAAQAICQLVKKKKKTKSHGVSAWAQAGLIHNDDGGGSK